ncbi:hypothetical protein B6U81_03210, partial [Thermoplasmatales archaeon ex4484_30]
MEKHNVSQYLKNLNFSVAKNDATLLEMESKYWKEIKFYLKELNETMKKGFLATIPILQNITNTIDKIIDVETEIIS